MINSIIQKSIEEASQVVGKTWPLYSFVTSNPLSGYEGMPFEKAVNKARKLLNANVFPETTLFRQAWDKGEIDETILLKLLEENQLLESPECYLQQMGSHKKSDFKNSHHDLDRIMAKWLAAFMDEGLAEWEMPNRNEGFYNAWRRLAVYDTDMPKTTISEIPKTKMEALVATMNGYSLTDFTKIFTSHLAALPGWVGYINHRTTYDSQWQQEYPITLEDYLAVRLWVAKKIDAEIYPEDNDTLAISSLSKLQYIWLKAWEKSWQKELVKVLDNQQISTSRAKKEGQVPDAQLVFCIDTRSELIRRHIENKGHYETFGYAGFFGIAMDYEDLKEGLTRKSCPPILNSAYHVVEIPQQNQTAKALVYKQKNAVLNFKEYFLKRMKNMLPSAFGYVEGAGFFYGMSLLARTLIPGYLYRFSNKNTAAYESVFEPQIRNTCTSEQVNVAAPLVEQVAIVKGAFDLMGWEKLAPLVLFIGHGSHSANNPFGSSLDCGACAASSGRHNARMLAKIANIPEVRQALKENHDIEIPASTIFIGGEHNTTTDEIVLFDSEVPDSHSDQLQKLKLKLLKTQQTATQERLAVSNNSIALANKKSNNWGETRPEWGLAKNAGFIVGSRELTKSNNLDGRCFLHSYNWEKDKSGKALEAIMQGPMVVTQWINNHYYFSTVDNIVFGGGSKITHNITGKFAVVQGNGGDIKMGLPLQSVMESDLEMYHQPLRLSVVIQAPVARVSDILLRNEHLKNLLDNEWIYLMVMDPLDGNKIHHYEQSLKWDLASQKSNTNNMVEMMPA
jgi:uncharacterized protein YbcC (UPF0753/DUF2309 family)